MPCQAFGELQFGKPVILVKCDTNAEAIDVHRRLNRAKHQLGGWHTYTPPSGAEWVILDFVPPRPNLDKAATKINGWLARWGMARAPLYVKEERR